MTTTINASTSSGLVQTADTSGALAIQTANTTAISIDSSQNVTFAKTPAATGGGSVATNTAFGTGALGSNTSGASNTAFGYLAGTTETTVNGLTAIGWGSGQTINNAGTDSYGSTFVGARAGTGVSSGIDNSFIGAYSGRNTTTGSTNVGIGAAALYSNTTASNNTAVGYQAGYSNTTGVSNAFFGSLTGYSNTTGTRNTFLGYYAGNANTTGVDNTYVGNGAGYLCTGSANTFIGTGTGAQAAGNAMTTGSKNTIIGSFNGNGGGLDIRTSSNYIVLSDGDGNPRIITTNNGYVGIGRTDPDAMLCVKSAAATQNVLRMTGSTTAEAYIELNNTGGAFYLGKDNSTGTSFGAAYSANLYSGGAYPMLFWTNSLERMRIDSSGNLVLAGTSSPNGARQFIYASTTQSGLTIQVGTNGNYGCNFFNQSGTNVGGCVANSGSVTYATSSDYRLKENIAPMTDALAKVSLLKPVTYTWKADGKNADGFIAHELAEVCPDAVVGEKDAVDEDGNPVYQGVDTSFLVATLTAAIQEQQAIISDLKARIETLENK